MEKGKQGRKDEKIKKGKKEGKELMEKRGSET